jgi:opacity protein-like surface antigen
MSVMRFKPLCVLAVASLGALPVTAQAQDKRVSVSLGGGFTVPNSEVKDHFGNGFNFNFGVETKVSPVIGIEGIYSFNGLGDKQISLPVSGTPGGSGIPTDFFAGMNMQYGVANLVLTKPDGPVKPYGLVGMGVYYRSVELTTPGVGYLPGYCNPWYYICVPGAVVPVENVIGSRSSTDFGMDFGGGVNFGAVYVELRYHYIWGPTVQTTGPSQPLPGVSSERKANGQFLATTFGLRF